MKRPAVVLATVLGVISLLFRSRQESPFPRRMAWFAPDGSRARAVRFP